MFKYHIFCCTNKRPDGHERGSCAAKDSERLRNYMKDKAKEMGLAETRVNSAGCLDCCEQGPVIVIYPEGTWYTAKTKADIDEILQTHMRDGKKVERLLMPKAMS